MNPFKNAVPFKLILICFSLRPSGLIFTFALVARDAEKHHSLHPSCVIRISAKVKEKSLGGVCGSETKGRKLSGLTFYSLLERRQLQLGFYFFVCVFVQFLFPLSYTNHMDG